VTHGCLPIVSGRRRFDLAGDELEDAVHDVVLVRDVVVERHGLDAELL
jgi:hypothetical protein